VQAESRPRPTARSLLRDCGILAVLAALCIYFGLATEKHVFLTPENLLIVADQISINTILAVGMTLVIITAGIDLSVGALVALTGTAAAWFVYQAAGVSEIATGGRQPVESAGLIVLGGCLLGVALGGVAGSFNGLMVQRFRVPPFITTLAMMLIAKGMGNIIAGGGRFGNLPEQFGTLGRGDLAGLPIPALVAAGVAALGQIALSRTAFGRHVYAVGGNEEAARLSGIRVGRVKFAVYAISGTLAGLGGVILASMLGAGDPTVGEYYELDAIAAVVLGGTSLMGGRGAVWRTVIGALIMGVLSNGMGLMDVPTFYQWVVRGAVILAAVITDQVTKE
jgi:ribose transport system permease protein